MLALFLIVEIIVIAPTVNALLPVGVALWMAVPGVLFVRRSLGSTSASRLTAWFVGPALGFGLSVSGLLLLWAAGVQGVWALALAPGLTYALSVVARRAGGAALRLPMLDRRDLTAAAVALLAVPIVTFVPFSHVRETTPDGEAYRAYFTADFVWAMTVTAELAKGDVPPANPFLENEPMRYYWMSHLLSGATYQTAARLGLSSERVVLINGLAFGLAFVLFFYWLVRASGGGPALAALAVLVGFLANSYEGLDMLRALAERGQPLDTVRTINIDAVTRWFYQGMPVDGLQRLLLYQPHHLTGYVFALSGLWLIGLASDVTDTSIALWAGILLGLGFLFSTFTAIIVGAAVGLLYGTRLVQQRAWGAVWQCAILGGAPVAVAIGVSTALGYTDPSQGMLLEFGINPVALRRWPFMWLLSFGPLLFAGVAGLTRWRWMVKDGTAVVALVVAATAFYFLADVPDMGGVWVGWRSGHLLLIGFAIIGAAAITAAWRGRARVAIAAAIALVVLPAIPTVAIDVYNAQDIDNREAGPTFPWTLIITPGERAALDWIKRATPTDAIVQVEPYARDSGTWAYVPAFAERRMAAGLPISMIPLDRYRVASDAVRAGIFQAVNARDAHASARSLGIAYLLIGDVERRVYGRAVAELAAHPELFVPVFQNEAITVYGVTR